MSEQAYFTYGEKETAALCAADPILGDAIRQIGHIDRPVIPDLFSALVNCIAGQQISSKALETIWARIQERFHPLTPEAIIAAPLEELQSCGISMRKAGYIRDAAQQITDGSLDLQALRELPDCAVCERLSALKGIGVWTAEMLLIFSMQRPDVVSFGDLAIQRGMRMLYHHRRITPELFRKYKRRYSPYGTVASLYLWAIANGAIPELRDYAPKKGA